jgi:hypothetical protein
MRRDALAIHLRNVNRTVALALVPVVPRVTPRFDIARALAASAISRSAEPRPSALVNSPRKAFEFSRSAAGNLAALGARFRQNGRQSGTEKPETERPMSLLVAHILDTIGADRPNKRQMNAVTL